MNKLATLPFFCWKGLAPASTNSPYFTYGGNYTRFVLKRIFVDWQMVGAAAGNHPIQGGNAAGALSLCSICCQVQPKSGSANTLMGDILDNSVGFNSAEAGFRFWIYHPIQLTFSDIIMNEPLVLTFTCVNQSAETVNYYIAGVVELDVIE